MKQIFRLAKRRFRRTTIDERQRFWQHMHQPVANPCYIGIPLHNLWYRFDFCKQELPIPFGSGEARVPLDRNQDRFIATVQNHHSNMASNRHVWLARHIHAVSISETQPVIQQYLGSRNTSDAAVQLSPCIEATHVDKTHMSCETSFLYTYHRDKYHPNSSTTHQQHN